MTDTVIDASEAFRARQALPENLEDASDYTEAIEIAARWKLAQTLAKEPAFFHALTLRESRLLRLWIIRPELNNDEHTETLKTTLAICSRTKGASGITEAFHGFASTGNTDAYLLQAAYELGLCARRSILTYQETPKFARKLIQAMIVAFRHGLKGESK